MASTIGAASWLTIIFKRVKLFSKLVNRRTRQNYIAAQALRVKFLSATMRTISGFKCARAISSFVTTARCAGSRISARKTCSFKGRESLEKSNNIVAIKKHSPIMENSNSEIKVKRLKTTSYNVSIFQKIKDSNSIETRINKKNQNHLKELVKATESINLSSEDSTKLLVMHKTCSQKSLRKINAKATSIGRAKMRKIFRSTGKYWKLECPSMRQAKVYLAL